MIIKLFVLLKLPKKRMAVSASGKNGSPMRLRPDAQRAINSVQVRTLQKNL